MIDDKVFKFVVAGIINSLLGITTMFGLYNVFHCSYFFSTAMNYVIGSISGFFLGKYFTFNAGSCSCKQIFKYVFNVVLCYVFAYGLAKPFVEFLLRSFSETIKDNISMFVGMVLFTAVNYFGQRYFVFADKN